MFVLRSFYSLFASLISCMPKLLTSLILLSACLSLNACYPERVESIKLMNDGIKAYRSGQSTTAIRLLARSAETDPTNHRALFYRGLILNDMGRTEEREDRFRDAVQSLEASVKINQEDPEVFYQLGVALAELKKEAEALRAFHNAQQNKSHGEAAYRSGLIYLAQEEYNKAQESFRTAIIAKPDLGLAYTQLALLYRRFNHTSSAATVLKTAIENDPETTGHYRDLGEVYAQLQQYPKAIQLYESALQDQPTNAPLTFLIGQASFYFGDTQSAEIYLNKYLRMGHTRDEKKMIAKAKSLLGDIRKK